MFYKVLHPKRGIFATYSVLGHNWLCTTYPQLDSEAFFANDLSLPIFVTSTDKCPLKLKTGSLLTVLTKPRNSESNPFEALFSSFLYKLRWELKERKDQIGVRKKTIFSSAHLCFHVFPNMLCLCPHFAIVFTKTQSGHGS